MQELLASHAAQAKYDEAERKRIEREAKAGRGRPRDPDAEVDEYPE